MLALLTLIRLLVFTASSSQEKIRTPHKSEIVGGLTRQTAEASENLERAWEAVKALNEGAANEGENLMIPIKVQKAESQVVAGIRYISEVLYGESTCKRNEAASNDFTELRARCQLKEGGKETLYKVDLWEKPWQNFEQFTITKMQDIRALSGK